MGGREENLSKRFSVGAQLAGSPRLGLVRPSVCLGSVPRPHRTLQDARTQRPRRQAQPAVPGTQAGSEKRPGDRLTRARGLARLQVDPCLWAHDVPPGAAART